MELWFGGEGGRELGRLTEFLMDRSIVGNERKRRMGISPFILWWSQAHTWHLFTRVKIKNCL